MKIVSLKIAVTRTEERQDKAWWLTKKRKGSWILISWVISLISIQTLMYVLADNVSALCLFFHIVIINDASTYLCLLGVALVHVWMKWWIFVVFDVLDILGTW